MVLLGTVCVIDCVGQGLSVEDVACSLQQSGDDQLF